MTAVPGNSLGAAVASRSNVSLDDAHREARKELAETQFRLQEIERLQHTQTGVPSGSRDATAASAATLEALQNLKQTLQRLECTIAELTLLASRAPLAERALWQRRAVQLQGQLQELWAFWRQLQATERQRHWHMHARESLLEGADPSGAKKNADTTVLDLEVLQEQALSRSSQQADGIVSSGHDILEALRQQHHTLRTVRRKTLNMAQRLGISQRLLRRIQRRARNDMRLVCGGFTSIALLLGTLWYMKHHVS